MTCCGLLFNLLKSKPKVVQAIFIVLAQRDESQNVPDRPVLDSFSLFDLNGLINIW
jgi:hypothetical protein